jgi:transcriptional regulator with AAA-type ATPase domain
MYSTQFELLQRIEELYSDIARITAQVDFEQENHEEILVEREKILNEIVSLQKQRQNLELGASVQQINERELKIRTLILAILSDSDPLLEEARVQHGVLKEKLSKVQTASRAAKSYAAQKRS